MINVCKICKQDSKLSEIDLDSVDIDLSINIKDIFA